jgi:hypothetical protein
MRTRSVAAASLSAALLLGTVVPAAAQDDPYQILTQAVTATTTATSFHVLVTVDGTINAGGSTGSVPLTLDGTKIEGDVSLDPLLVSLLVDVPIPGLAISGGVIIPDDGNLYVKLALPLGSVDDLWHRMPAGDLVIPPNLASPPPVEDLTAQLKAELDAAGITLTNAGDAACAAGTCTRIHLDLPVAALGDSLGGVIAPEASVAPGSSPAPAAPIPVDILVDKASGRLDSISAQVSDAASGTQVTLAVTISAYDQPVTVSAPPADQTTDEPLAILQMFQGLFPTP